MTVRFIFGFLIGFLIGASIALAFASERQATAQLESTPGQGP